MKSCNQNFVSPATAEQKHSAGNSTILDVRTDVEFAEQQIPGSLHIPLDRLAEKCSQLDSRSHFSLLCLSGKRATTAAGILTTNGFENIDIIEGGLTSWQAAGLPVEKSTRKTLPLMRQVQLTIGVLALTGSLLAIFLNPLFAILPAFLGAGLTFAGATGWCGLAILLSKMPWNRCPTPQTSCCNA